MDWSKQELLSMANGGRNRGVGTNGVIGSRNDLAHHGCFKLCFQVS